MRHEEHVWQPAEVSCANPLVVKTCPEDEDEEEIEINDQSENTILIRNIAPHGKQLPADLILLPHLNEAAILNVLRMRYRSDVIYTATGPIIIALNPFKRMPIYSEAVLEKYLVHTDGSRGSPLIQEKEENPGELPPHVFSVARGAYFSMFSSGAQQGRNQSVLISGESGAGKTVSTKHVMQYLAIAGADGPSVDSPKASARKKRLRRKSEPGKADGVAEQILQSNPILEAFGNARTLRNDNSSRFGKFIKMNFNSKGVLVGAMIKTYLLEKVRLVQQAQGERNYHIFYQMAAGATEEESELWQVFPLEGCRYTNQSDCYERADGVDDAEEWNTTRQAMNVMGFTPEEQNSLFTTTSALMHLSCVEFVSLARNGKTGEEGCRIGLYEAAAAAASLIEVSSDDMETVLCSRTIEAGGQKHIVPNSKEQAEYARDAMAKCIYGKMFDWIVQRINKAIQTTSKKTGSFIGILDIFGFEVFEENSFEQLCINYANESLQQQFNQFMFKLEQNIYEKEGIDWSFIDFPDNAECLALIEKNRTGVIALLDETCIFPKGTDPMFARKLYQKCVESQSFFASKKNVVDNEFVIKHYAGDVTYNSVGFCDKNKDKLHQDIMNLLKSAGLPLIKTIFSDEFALALETEYRTPTKSTGGRRGSSTPGSGSRRGSKYSTVNAASIGSQFKSELGALMNTINETSPHYIRCIKPNDENESEYFDAARVVAQLRYGGVLQAVQVARAGYPCRVHHKVFVPMYALLRPKGSVPYSGTIREQSLQLLQSIEFGKEVAQVGKTKVFFRRGAYDDINSRRKKAMHAAITQLQSLYRSFVERKAYHRIRLASTIICSLFRAVKARAMVQEMRRLKATVQIQAFARYWKHRNAFLKLRLGTLTAQRVYRVRLALLQARSLRLNRSSYILQKQYRMHVGRKLFLSKKQAVTRIACAVRVVWAKQVRKRLYRESREVGNLHKKLAEMQEQLKVTGKGSTSDASELSKLNKKLDAEKTSKQALEVELERVTTVLKLTLRQKDDLQKLLQKAENEKAISAKKKPKAQLEDSTCETDESIPAAEVDVYKEKMIALENMNERLRAELKKLEVRGVNSASVSSNGEDGQLAQTFNAERDAKIIELEHALEEANGSLLKQKLQLRLGGEKLSAADLVEENLIQRAVDSAEATNVKLRKAEALLDKMENEKRSTADLLEVLKNKLFVSEELSTTAINETKVANETIEVLRIQLDNLNQENDEKSSATISSLSAELEKVVEKHRIAVKAYDDLKEQLGTVLEEKGLVDQKLSALESEFERVKKETLLESARAEGLEVQLEDALKEKVFETERANAVEMKLEKITKEKESDTERSGAFEMVKVELEKLTEANRLAHELSRNEKQHRFESEHLVPYQKLVDVTALLDSTVERNHKLRELHEAACEKELEQRKAIHKLENGNMELQRAIKKCEGELEDLHELAHRESERKQEHDTLIDNLKNKVLEAKNDSVASKKALDDLQILYKRSCDNQANYNLLIEQHKATESQLRAEIEDYKIHKAALDQIENSKYVHQESQFDYTNYHELVEQLQAAEIVLNDELSDLRRKLAEADSQRSVLEKERAERDETIRKLEINEAILQKSAEDIKASCALTAKAQQENFTISKDELKRKLNIEMDLQRKELTQSVHAETSELLAKISTQSGEIFNLKQKLEAKEAESHSKLRMDLKEQLSEISNSQTALRNNYEKRLFDMQTMYEQKLANLKLEEASSTQSEKKLLELQMLHQIKLEDMQKNIKAEVLHSLNTSATNGSIEQQAGLVQALKDTIEHLKEGKLSLKLEIVEMQTKLEELSVSNGELRNVEEEYRQEIISLEKSKDMLETALHNLEEKYEEHALQRKMELEEAEALRRELKEAHKIEGERTDLVHELQGRLDTRDDEKKELFDKLEALEASNCKAHVDIEKWKKHALVGKTVKKELAMRNASLVKENKQLQFVLDEFQRKQDEETEPTS